jgi:xanthine dehydrogenase YagR molybdenum-binding subunit
MTAYIGLPTARVDGRAKVTGAAQYAAEFNAPGLAYGSVVVSTIAKGRIRRIDCSAARAVAGVIEVLTHENRPRMAGSDNAYQDDVAPGGSPFRPLYDNKVKFNGQPIALVLAESSEAARFAASLVVVEYEREDSATDLHTRLDEAFAVDKPEKPRGDADKAFAAADVRHEAEYFIPVEHHNPMELFAATVVWDAGGKLTVYDKTQGVQNVQRYLCGVFDLKPDQVRVVSPFVGGAFGAGLRPAVRSRAGGIGCAGAQALGARRADTRADVWAGLPSRNDRASCTRRQQRGHARRHQAQRHCHDVAIRGVLAQRHGLVGDALQIRQRKVRAQARPAGHADAG